MNKKYRTLSWAMILAPFLLSCCSSTDPEYAQKAAGVRADWKGREITGVWLSKLKNTVNDVKETILLRPDGTGIWRCAGSNVLSSYSVEEHPFTWHYAGNGVWSGHYQNTAFQKSMSVRYTGHELLVQTLNFSGHRFDQVFVPADDERAIAEHLRNRR